jgi:hypothetical protein
VSIDIHFFLRRRISPVKALLPLNIPLQNHPPKAVTICTQTAKKIFNLHPVREKNFPFFFLEISACRLSDQLPAWGVSFFLAKWQKSNPTPMLICDIVPPNARQEFPLK